MRIHFLSVKYANELLYVLPGDSHHSVRTKEEASSYLFLTMNERQACVEVPATHPRWLLLARVCLECINPEIAN